MPTIDPETGAVKHERGSQGASCDWLREHLHDQGIRVHPDTPLARALLEYRTITNEVGRFPSVEQALSKIQDLAGTDFISKAIHRGHIAGLRPGRKVLECLASKEFNVLKPVGVAQSTKDRFAASSPRGNHLQRAPPGAPRCRR